VIVFIQAVIQHNAMNIIDISKQIEFTYPEDEHYIYCIPKGIHIAAGKMYSIQGISGSGKSTLLTLLAALRRFRHGMIQYTFGTKKTIQVTSANWKKTIGPEFWGNIGFSFQKPELIRALTVKKNLDLAIGKALTEKMALALFDKKEWESIKDSRIWKLSGGQTQRLGLIRAFGANQNLVFMDEPTNNLDKNNRQRVVDFIQKYCHNKSCVFVSHDQSFLEMLNIDTTFEVREESKGQRRSQRILQPCVI
jgi:putative ABC transport system ATP-binding protein